MNAAGTRTAALPPLRRAFVAYVVRALGRWRSVPDLLLRVFWRPLVAPSFAAFWQRWNPFVGFWLARYIYAPLRRPIGRPAALLFTFALSGFALHDAATMLLKQRLALLTSLWFTLMGPAVLVSQLIGFRYEHLPAPAHVLVNITYVALSFLGAEAVRNLLLGPPS